MFCLTDNIIKLISLFNGKLQNCNEFNAHIFANKGCAYLFCFRKDRIIKVINVQYYSII